MNRVYVSLLVLAAPLFLGACGSSADAPAPLRQSVATGSSALAPPQPNFSGQPRASYTITRSAGYTSVTSKNSPPTSDAVPPTGRIRFADTSIALDVDGVAGKAYRLYRAAFGRSPDIPGLSYWIAAMDGGRSHDRVASDFTQSAEFTALYGDKPANADMVARLYSHVLGRAGDPAGIAYWTGLLDKQQATLAQVLVGFSESIENKQLVLPYIDLGIAYTEPGVTYWPAPTARGLAYKIQAPVANGAEAQVRLNEQGALGYAYVDNIVNWTPQWSADLYATSSPLARYSYEVASVDTATAAERLARFQQWGARGYVHKSTAVFGAQTLSPYDVFVKSSALATTYHYRLDGDTFTHKTLNEQGVQGYAYRGHLYIGGRGYALYVKDMTSDAVFEYVRADHKEFDSGLMAQLAMMGSRSYAYLGAILEGDGTAALYVRSSVSPAPISYSAAPKAAGSAQAAADALILRAQQGEAYLGDVMGVNGPMSISYNGGWITQPMVGVTFPQN